MNENTMKIGAIVSADLTIPNASEIRDFYTQVIGWESEDVSLNDDNGTYSDYVMKDKAGNWVGGVCHARGVNIGIPPQWIIYVTVADVAASLKCCAELGGKVLKVVRGKGDIIQYAFIQDPAGAVMALTKEG